MHTKQPSRSSHLSISKYIIWIGFAAIGFIPFVQAQSKQKEIESKLPSDDKHLIARLKEYETREKNKLDRLLNKKRVEVLTILKKHFTFRTKNGQLDQALAIRKEIERIEALLPRNAPKRLYASNKAYEFNGKLLPREKLPDPVFFSVDGNDAKGRIFLTFKHPQLSKIFNTAKVVYLELNIADQSHARSVDSVVIKHKTQIIGQKLAPKQGDRLKIKLDAWKVVQTKSSITLSIENSGADAFNVQINKKPDFVALIFSDK